MLLSSLQFSLSVTLPTILMMLLGVFLRRRQILDDRFCEMASKLIFNFSLPTLIFLNVLKSPNEYTGQFSLLATGFVGTVLIYLLAEIGAAKYVKERRYRGIFVQGTFRSNSAILGLALAINAYGNSVIGAVSVYTAMLIILFNTFGVITLTLSLSDNKPNIGRLLISIAKNPLILATLLGMLANPFQAFIPKSLMQTGNYLANITLPLALICTGASLNFKQLRKFKDQSEGENTNQTNSQVSQIVWVSSFIRLLIAPIFMLALGKFVFQLDPMSLGVVFLTTATPVASATYAMVRNYGGDATAAANLIGITTIGSIFTSSIGLFVLRQMGWV